LIDPQLENARKSDSRYTKTSFLWYFNAGARLVGHPIFSEERYDEMPLLKPEIQSEKGGVNPA